jgi:FkbM family methyltransferase
MDVSEKIFDLYKNVYNKIFLDIGANDGFTQSNTYELETKNNWTGLLIEPSVKWKDKLIKERPNSIIECAAVSNYTGTIQGDFDGSLMSSVNGKRLYDDVLKHKGIHIEINNVEVPCYTLTDICKKHNMFDIELCSIDVEGHECDVLDGLDFSQIKINRFIIEVYKEQEEKIFKLFKENNYTIECFSNFNKNTNIGWDGLHQDYLFTKEI